MDSSAARNSLSGFTFATSASTEPATWPVHYRHRAVEHRTRDNDSSIVELYHRLLMPELGSNLSESTVQRLEKQLGADWTAIRKARATTKERRSVLRDAFEGKLSPDTSLVLFGSVAREEMTSASDADWILLVDGQSSPDHEVAKHEASNLLNELGFGEPGKSGVFGCLVGSHSLIHDIGGEDDTNSNTTRRVLLLLESLSIGDREAYARVRRQILNRYLNDDRGLLYGSGARRVPRFLLNDLTRYWRTVTVDFVYKQRAEAGKKWALRNAKLRMSRKLVFASGLLRAFFCHLDPNAATARAALVAPFPDASKLLAYMEAELAKCPLDLLAAAASRPAIESATAKKLFDNYDRFLAVLDSDAKRDELSSLIVTQTASSVVWREIRELSRGFHEGMVDLFFGKDEELRALTMEYGLF
jgi:predicted nucleotidyltransferase